MMTEVDAEDARSGGRVVVLHGYGASPKDHWFPWLGLELADHGIEVTTPHLPNSDQPTAGRWIDAARSAIGRPDLSTVVVGHSLGTITALRALDGIAGSWNLAGLILVAGFDRPLPSLPELDDFTRSTTDYRAIVSHVRARHILISSDDGSVPPAYSRDVAAKIGATIHLIPNAGHFLRSDGFVRLPLVAEIARAALRRPRDEA